MFKSGFVLWSALQNDVIVVVVVVGLNQPVPTANGPGLQGSRDPFSPFSGGLGSLFYTIEIA